MDGRCGQNGQDGLNGCFVQCVISDCSCNNVVNIFGYGIYFWLFLWIQEFGGGNIFGEGKVVWVFKCMCIEIYLYGVNGFGR